MSVDGASPSSAADPLRVVIAGGGVAALEALVALRRLAEGRIHAVLVSASDTFVYRPLLVGEPFGLGQAHRYDLATLCDELGAELVVDTATAVLAPEHLLRTAANGDMAYDVLLVALGAVPYAPFDHGAVFERQLSPDEFDAVLADLDDGEVSHLAIVVPDGVAWSLPAYELALLTTARAERRQPGRTSVTVLTHEAAPLEVFGRTASTAVAGLLEAEGVQVRCGVHPEVVSAGTVRLGDASLQADRIVSLPLLAGPRLRGLPADPRGFIPCDRFGRVADAEDVYVAGDCGTFPLKQGGLAAQEALVAATGIAARAGAEVAPRELDPVLRAVLLTRQGYRYLRAELADVEGTSTLAAEPLWWPASKIASPWLAPYLARLDGAEHVRSST